MRKTLKRCLLATLSVIMLVCSVMLAACAKPSVSLDKTSATINEGETTTIVATVENYDGDVNWSSSDESVATVSNGVVFGVKAGKATITATADKAQAKCEVTVNSIAVWKADAEYKFYVGDNVDFNEYVEKIDGVEYSFKIKQEDNEAKAIEDGVFKTYKKGEYVVTLTAKTEEITSTANKTILFEERLQKGVTENADGTVTLSGVHYTEACGFFSVANKIDNSYIAWEGEYGVGTFVEFEFKGNNMPTVMFFADAIHGNMTNYHYLGSHQENVLDENGQPVLNADGTNKTQNVHDYELLNQKGLIVTPGIATENKSGWTNGNIHRFTIYGPNRFESSADAGQTCVGNAGNHNVAAAISYAYLNRVEGTAVNPLGGTFDMFVQGGTQYQGAGVKEGLSSEKYANTNFKYVVGTVQEGDKVFVVAKMYNADTNTLIGELTVDTKLTADTLTAGSIVAYAAVKQDGGDTTFKYKAPYTND